MINWLYVQYAPDSFTAQIRIGYDYYMRSILYARPSFYYNLFNKAISVGASFEFAQDFADAKPYYQDAPYLRMVVEPMVKWNFGPASYLAAVYQYRTMYRTTNSDQRTEVQAFNLRLVYTF